jgi:hypothetical protein
MNQPSALQIVVDCVSPHDLADWWAETLAWGVEPQDETFIRSMIEQGFATESDTTLHNGSLVWSAATAIRPDGAPGQGQPRVLFQKVPETKTMKNRIHLDVRPPDAADLTEMHQRLVERGAAEISRGEQGPHQWVTYADPEGNEFCVDT